MRAALLVALGGGAGSLLRYLVGLAAAARLGSAFPYGTLAVNLVGSFAIGLSVPLLKARFPDAWALIVPGLLGGFTTFSAFEYEALALVAAGARARALTYVTLSVAVGLAACWAGARLAQTLGGAPGPR